MVRHHRSRFPRPVAALSTCLAGGRALESEPGVANAGIPVFQAHGTDDPLIPIERGEETRDRLEALGHPVVWKAYPMQHEVCQEEIADLGAWLRERLAG